MSIYTTATLGEPDNYISFNNYSSNPVYRTTTRAPRKFQTRSDDLPIPYESGISDFQTLIGETLYVIQGKMYPQDESSYDAGIAALRAVCSVDLEQADTYSTDEGYVPYTWGEVNGGNKTLYVKALYVEFAEDTRQGFIVPFTIFCKVKDPTVYSATSYIASTQLATPSSSGGAGVFSVAFPLTFGSSVYTVSSAATNNGNISVYPAYINVYGPVTTPVITNTKNGQFIKVAVTLNSNSDNLYIAYSKDSLTVTLNGVSVVNKVTTDTNYWKIAPGGNVIQLSGASVGTGAYATVGYQSGYALA